MHKGEEALDVARRFGQVDAEERRQFARPLDGSSAAIARPGADAGNLKGSTMALQLALQRGDARIHVRARVGSAFSHDRFRSAAAGSTLKPAAGACRLNAAAQDSVARQNWKVEPRLRPP